MKNIIELCGKLKPEHMIILISFVKDLAATTSLTVQVFIFIGVLAWVFKITTDNSKK